MRKLIITLLKDKFTFLTKTITYSDIIECEELFLSNAISGVRWVGSFGEKEFVKKDMSSYLINELNKLI
jgi:branched-chain amino acid aminotransferase